MALDARIHVGVTATQTSPLDLASASAPHALDKSVVLTNGTGANQVDRVFSDTRTIAASATDSLDLAGGLTDAFGATITFARVKSITVTAASGNTNNVLVTRPATNGVPIFSAAGDQVPVRPNGYYSVGCTDATGYAVTAGTGDLIDIINSGAGTSVTYDIVILGCSA